MPARKNNPNKFHGAIKDYSKLLKTKLATYLWEAEGKTPNSSHYVGWPDMTEAEMLRKEGLLREDPRVKGCFYITDRFRSKA